MKVYCYNGGQVLLNLNGLPQEALLAFSRRSVKKFIEDSNIKLRDDSCQLLDSIKTLKGIEYFVSFYIPELIFIFSENQEDVGDPVGIPKYIFRVGALDIYYYSKLNKSLNLDLLDLILEVIEDSSLRDTIRAEYLSEIELITKLVSTGLSESVPNYFDSLKSVFGIKIIKNEC